MVHFAAVKNIKNNHIFSLKNLMQLINSAYNSILLLKMLIKNKFQLQKTSSLGLKTTKKLKLKSAFYKFQENIEHHPHNFHTHTPP